MCPSILPGLLSVNGVPFTHIYTVMLFMACVVSFVWLVVRWVPLGISKKELFAFVVLTLLVSLVCARVHWVLVSRPSLFVELMKPWTNEGFGYRGLAFLGGLIGGALFIGVYLAAIHPRIPLSLCFDRLAPVVGIDILLVRIGCFFAGCCGGRPTSSWCGISFPPSSATGRLQALNGWERVYPTQLMSAANGLALFLLLWFVQKRQRRPHAWLVTRLFFAEYAAFRMVLDYFRYYPRSETLWSLTHNQWVCLTLLFITVLPIWKQSGSPGESRTDRALSCDKSSASTI